LGKAVDTVQRTSSLFHIWNIRTNMGTVAIVLAQCQSPRVCWNRDTGEGLPRGVSPYPLHH
jgi:hypothetical protein